MAEFICLALLFVAALYCAYRYGFVRALNEYREYLIESIKRDEQNHVK